MLWNSHEDVAFYTKEVACPIKPRRLEEYEHHSCFYGNRSIFLTYERQKTRGSRRRLPTIRNFALQMCHPCYNRIDPRPRFTQYKEGALESTTKLTQMASSSASAPLYNWQAGSSVVQGLTKPSVEFEIGLVRQERLSYLPTCSQTTRLSRQSAGRETHHRA